MSSRGSQEPPRATRQWGKTLPRTVRPAGRAVLGSSPSGEGGRGERRTGRGMCWMQDAPGCWEWGMGNAGRRSLTKTSSPGPGKGGAPFWLLPQEPRRSPDCRSRKNPQARHGWRGAAILSSFCPSFFSCACAPPPEHCGRSMQLGSFELIRTQSQDCTVLQCLTDGKGVRGGCFSGREGAGLTDTFWSLWRWGWPDQTALQMAKILTLKWSGGGSGRRCARGRPGTGKTSAPSCRC